MRKKPTENAMGPDTYSAIGPTWDTPATGEGPCPCSAEPKGHTSSECPCANCKPVQPAQECRQTDPRYTDSTEYAPERPDAALSRAMLHDRLYQCDEPMRGEILAHDAALREKVAGRKVRQHWDTIKARAETANEDLQEALARADRLAALLGEARRAYCFANRSDTYDEHHVLCPRYDEDLHTDSCLIARIDALLKEGK